ncbi:MAG: hypothetical protein A2Y38_00305 [Spirochaetes bacterium GWB1_59_5]|nr:MAG: hypothetical protein A2Y38_00305 [Spirochaetes bacterium GWB1_59_5]
MKTISIEPSGYEALETAIARVQAAVDRGIADPVRAMAALREARTELFRLRETLRDKVVITAPDDPDAA